MSNERPLMTGLFPDRQSAELGYGSLSERGYGKDDTQDHTEDCHYPS